MDFGGGFTDVHKVWSSNNARDLRSLSSDHEEADTRIILHARDAALSGFQQVNVISRDTDVLVLLVAHLPLLCPNVWMFTGTAQKNLMLQYIKSSSVT